MNFIKTNMRPLAYLAFILFLSSCCKSELIQTIRFSEEDLGVNPYSGNEELRFIDNNNNVIVYKNGYRTINQGEINECDGGCCDYYLVEISDNTLFESVYKKSNIQVIISNVFDKHTGIREMPIIHFAWHYYEIEPYVTGTSFGGLPVDSMQEKAIEYGIYRDSIMVRNKIYYEIYEFPGESPYPDRLHGDILYYSIKEGVIGLKFSDGNLWTRP